MNNLRLYYILTALRYSWFWLGIWIFYYLRLTDYMGIGIIETISIMGAVILEIPTGAIADLLGKKKTIILSFVFEGLGSFVMAFASIFGQLLIALPFLAIGKALYSGTNQALLYDSLKEEGRENIYGKALSHSSSIQLVAFALATIVGGYLYEYSPGLPFLLVGILYMVGATLSLWLREPKIDTELFSWSNYVRQTKRGFGNLFTAEYRSRMIYILLFGSAVFYVATQALNDIIGVELGFSPTQWSYVVTLIFLVSAVVAQVLPYLERRYSVDTVFVVALLGVALSLIVTPYFGLLLGALVVILRFAMQTIGDNAASIIVNKQTPSRDRATTLSTYNLLAHLPYAIGASAMGAYINSSSSLWFSFYLGLVVVLVVIFNLVLRRKAS